MIRLQDVRFRYDGGGFSLPVADLHIARGERVACIGPSGTGKTTLINLVAGILLPDSGRVHLGNLEVSGLPDPQRRAARIARIGMIFQDFELLDYLTGMDNVLLPYHVSKLRLTREVEQRARDLAEATGVTHTLDRRPASLSQGERQRIAICRALVTQPDVIMGDEPTGNLDPTNAAGILDLLFEQVERHGATLLMVTHDHGLLPRFDRVLDITELGGPA